jgi:rSAM/selenodomain-associated transferase 1
MPNDSLAMRHAASATLPSMRRALLIVGKAPVPGRTKTRLVPPLSPDEAAELYRGFLLDCVSLGLELGWERVSVIHPARSGDVLAALLSAQVTLVEQAGHGLGDALSSAFEHHLAEGFQRVVLIGSDNPTLPLEPIRAACAALDEHDLSIGPTVDGGYYLIGMRAAHMGVFAQIEWSTPRVYAQTLAQAHVLGLRVRAVQEWYDVDEPPDLARLRDDLLRLPSDVAPNTRAALDRLSLTVLSR